MRASEEPSPLCALAGAAAGDLCWLCVARDPYSRLDGKSANRMGAMLTEPVTVERDGHVLLIGVNRPAKRNAFNLAAIEALGGAYESLGTDDELRAGVLFAHGDHLAPDAGGP
jgi:hypothetical protein